MADALGGSGVLRNIPIGRTLRRIVGEADGRGVSRRELLDLAERLQSAADWLRATVLGLGDRGVSPRELLDLAEQLDGGELAGEDLAALLVLAHHRAAASALLDVDAAAGWRGQLERRLLALGRGEVLGEADRQIARTLGEAPK